MHLLRSKSSRLCQRRAVQSICRACDGIWRMGAQSCSLKMCEVVRRALLVNDGLSLTTWGTLQRTSEGSCETKDKFASIDTQHMQL